MASDAPSGEGVLTVRVWHETGGGFRARVLCSRTGSGRTDSLMLGSPRDVLGAVSAWLQDLDPGDRAQTGWPGPDHDTSHRGQNHRK